MHSEKNNLARERDVHPKIRSEMNKVARERPFSSHCVFCPGSAMASKLDPLTMHVGARELGCFFLHGFWTNRSLASYPVLFATYFGLPGRSPS